MLTWPSGCVDVSIDVSIDGASDQSSCDARMALPARGDGATHTITVHAHVLPVCVGITVAPMTVISWIDWDTSGGPGVPRFVSVPDAHSTSSFCSFVFACSAATAQFECSTAGAPFAPCASVYRAGPLQAGNQSLAMRTVSLTGQRSDDVIVDDNGDCISWR